MAAVLLIVVVTIAVFSPAFDAEFVNWDDDQNLIKNTGYRGLTWSHFRWMLSAVVMGHYIPMTWLSFGVDYAIWGMDPRGYHFTNVVLHTAGVLTFFAVALRLLRRATTLTDGPRLLGATAAALFFAVHPLRTESVAWVTERRDVLSGLFFMLTILAYLAAQEGPPHRRRRVLLTLSVSAFVLAAASKSIVMGLPLALLILDVYPLRRLTPGLRALRDSREVLWEKLPYALVALATAAASYYMVRTYTPLTTFDAFPWSGRIAMVFYTLWFYVTRTVVPISLSPLYELPRHLSLLQPRFAMAAGAVVLATFVLFRLRRRWPAGLAAWAFYAVILAPVSGVVHAGLQLAHDRYSYLSCLGWALIFGGVIGTLVQARPVQTRRGLERLAFGTMAAWMLTLGWLTWQQTHMWRDSFALWTNALDADPTCSVCHGNLAAYLVNQGEIASAMHHARTAITLRPERPRPHATLGHALAKADRPAEAIPHFEWFLRTIPDSPDIVTSLGVARLRAGRPDALEPLERAVIMDPKNTIARVNYAAGLVAVGQRDRALEEYHRALAGDPYSPEARHALGWALVQFGRLDDARRELRLLTIVDTRLAKQLERDIDQARAR